MPDVELLVDGAAGLAAVEPAPVVADEAVVPVVDVAADPVADSSEGVALDVELVEEDSEDGPVVSAPANP